MKRTSEILNEIVAASGKEEISVGDFMSLLGDRSFALAILIFSLPNSLPLPTVPGFSALTAVPIFFMALQLVWGRKAVWLPRRVSQKRFHQHMLVKMIQKALPSITWLEKFLKPRVTAMCESMGERVIGMVIAVMAFILALPIFGGNFLPGLSISLLALALLENDGLLAVLSLAFCILSFYLMYQLIALVSVDMMDWISSLL